MKILLLVAFILLPSLSLALSKVEFEWEEVDGAKSYQVEIRNKQNFLRSLQSQTSIFKTEMTPGRYEIRGKAGGLNLYEAQSEWSPWKSFDIPPPAVKLSKLPPTENKVSSSSYMSEIPLAWSMADGAAEYIVDIQDEQGKVVKSVRVQKPETLLKLRPGYYSIHIRSKTADGLESESVALPERIMIQNISVPVPQKIVFKTEKNSLDFEPTVGTQVEVSLEMQKFLGTEWKLIERQLIQGSSYNWKQNLKPGRYRLTLFSKNSFGEVSSPTTHEFIKKPTEDELPE
ncbi:hypothetical protein D3C87_1188510 [compost metagenome]